MIFQQARRRHLKRYQILLFGIPFSVALYSWFDGKPPLLNACVITFFGLSAFIIYRRLRATSFLLLERDQQLEKLSRLSPIMTVQCNNKFEVTFANSAFRHKFFPTANNEIGSNLAHFFDPEDWSKIKEQIHSEKGPQPQVFETTLRFRSGLAMKSLLEIVFDFDGSGTILIFITDLTAVYESRRDFEQYKAAIDQLALVSVTDKYGGIRLVNERFIKVTGFSWLELVNQNQRVVKSNYHPREFYDNLWRTIQSNKIWNGEICNMKKDGSLFWLDTTIVPGKDLNGQIENYVALSFDVTARKNAEKDRLAANEKMASLGVMAASIAHEINNHLSVILGTSQIVRKRSEDSSILDNICKIQQSAERINKIIKSLRGFSRNDQKDPMTPLRMSALFADVAALCGDKLKKTGVQLTFEGEDSIELICHPSQMTQVIFNLVNNSMDAIEKLDERWIRIGCQVLESGSAFPVRVEITDSGPGIPEAIVTNLMRPFFSTKEVGKGTGLGLCICKTIVEAHGGHFVYNPKSAHTQFVIELPWGKAEAHNEVA